MHTYNAKLAGLLLPGLPNGFCTAELRRRLADYRESGFLGTAQVEILHPLAFGAARQACAHGPPSLWASVLWDMAGKR